MNVKCKMHTIMKKTYIIPAVQVVEVRMTEMLALSTYEYAAKTTGDSEGAVMETKGNDGWDLFD